MYEAQHKYGKTEKGKQTYRRYYQKNCEEITARHSKYRQTEKGKLANRKVTKKSRAKRKNLDWIPLFKNPFDALEKIDWHHVTDAYVVALPKDLHQLYYGKQHREMMINIINQIYGG